MTNRNATLHIWHDANAKRESERFVATLRMTDTVMNFRAREEERAIKLANEFIAANRLTVTNLEAANG